MSETRHPSAARRLAPLAAVRGVAEVHQYLYEVIQTITAGPDLDTILRGVVRLVTEATACHACFVYFLRHRTLELVAAPHLYAHLEGRIRIPLGEGLTGWVAKTRRPAYIREGALDDPRVRRAFFPELGDEVYQSLVSVPMFARAGDVIGVITLHAEAPHEFGRADLDFLEVTAALIAGAIENAHTYEEATERVALLSRLSELSRRIASATMQADLLTTVASGVRDLVSARRCDIVLIEGDGRARVVASSPPTETEQETEPSESLDALLGEEARHASGPPDRASEAGRPRDFRDRYVARLIADGKRLGGLVVVTDALSPDEEMVIESVAAHAAVALVKSQLIDHLREQNVVRDFFNGLAKPDVRAEEVGPLAQRLGWDLEATCVVIHVMPWGTPVGRSRGPRRQVSGRTWPARATVVETNLSTRFPRVVVDSLERSLRGLLPLGDASPEELVTVLRDMECEESGDGAVAVGVSNPCQGLGSFAAGFDEARSAAEVGALLRGSSGVTGFEELGPYRYALSAEGMERDGVQQRVRLLVEYDERRGTHLLDTLEAYLTHRGNALETARALYVHPNTLRQRLKRIARLTGIELQRDDWVTLSVAAKAVRLRMMRKAFTERGSDG